jgi:transposase-like protein
VDNHNHTVEQALVPVVPDAYVKGVSTRKVDDLVQAFCMCGISKSLVSKLYSELDERVQRLLERELTEQWSYVWLDLADGRMLGVPKCRRASPGHWGQNHHIAFRSDG